MTNLLSGVARILIYPRLFPCLADVGLFVRTQLNMGNTISLL